MQAPFAAQAEESLDELSKHAETAAQAAGPSIELLGRLGYAAKGVVYLVVGGLAVQTALGSGGQTTDKQGALAHIAQLPFGVVLLGVLIVGLLGYALWQGLRAALDADHKGSDAKGIFARLMYAGIAVIYVGFSISAMQLLMSGEGSQGSSEKTQGWTAWLMGQPFGTWLVVLGGLAVIANGCAQLTRAFKSDLTDDLHLTDVGAQHSTLVTRIGRAGYAARGVAFLMIGGFLVGAAWHHNPSEAQGLDGILATLAAQPFGPYLLGAVALGLAAYGLFALVEARYRRMVLD